MNDRNYISYILALVSITLAVSGLVSEKYLITASIVGITGICVTIITLKINYYIRQINNNTKDIYELKRELNYLKKFQELKEEIISLKNEINKKLENKNR